MCSWLKLLHGFIWDFSQAHEPALSQWRQKHNLVFTFQCFLSLSSTLNLVGAHTLPNYFCAWLNQTNFNCTYSILLVVSLFCLCIHRFFWYNQWVCCGQKQQQGWNFRRKNSLDPVQFLVRGPRTVLRTVPFSLLFTRRLLVARLIWGLAIRAWNISFVSIVLFVFLMEGWWKRIVQNSLSEVGSS